MNILALGDVVGRAGRTALARHLPALKKELELDFVLANAENAAGCVGMTNTTLDEIFAAGVDLVTSGNHAWKHREILSRLEWDKRVLRPANYPDFYEKTPGRGAIVHRLADGREIAVLNLLGTTYMECLPCPFQNALFWAEQDLPKTRLVDFHAEASSEKKTLAWLMDGKISALFGTHTHVQTADAQILPKGTAYLTDLGMCGVEISSLGMDADSVLRRFLTRRPQPFKPAKGPPSLNGAFIRTDDDSGFAGEIRLIRVDCPRTSA